MADMHKIPPICVANLLSARPRGLRQKNCYGATLAEARAPAVVADRQQQHGDGELTWILIEGPNALRQLRTKAPPGT